MGPVGTAAATKLALNQLIAALTAGFALSLGFVQRQGVDEDKFMELLRDSALYAPTFDKKLNRMQEGNFADPNFPLKHLLKDINLFLSEAKAEGLEASSLAGVRQVVEKAKDAGLADEDYSSLYLGITQTFGWISTWFPLRFNPTTRISFWLTISGGLTLMAKFATVIVVDLYLNLQSIYQL